MRGRFPEAAALPPRPELDALLDEVGADREWRTGPWRARATIAHDGGHRQRIMAVPRYPTTAPPPEATPEVLDARALEEKLAHAADRGFPGADRRAAPGRARRSRIAAPLSRARLSAWNA